MTTFEVFKKHPFVFMFGCRLILMLTFVVSMALGTIVGMKPVDIDKVVSWVKG